MATADFSTVRSPPTMTDHVDSARICPEIGRRIMWHQTCSSRHLTGEVKGFAESQPQGLTHFQLTFPLLHFSTFPLT